MLRRNDSTMNMNICAESRSEGLDSITKDAIKWNVNKLEKIQFQVLLDSEYFAENILEKVSLYVSEQKISNPVLVKALSKRHSWTIFAASDERRMWTRFQRCQTQGFELWRYIHAFMYFTKNSNQCFVSFDLQLRRQFTVPLYAFPKLYARTCASK